MLNIFRIFIGDLKKISRNAIAWIVVLGLTVVPSLYACSILLQAGIRIAIPIS